MKLCKVCGNKLYDEPILKYHDMPKRAQFFLEEMELKMDKGIPLFVYQCSGCGLIQLDLEPVPYYKDVIRASGISEEMKKYRKAYFSEFIDKYSLGHKKIIEIGCGCGEFLEILNQTEAQVYGLENSKEAVEICLEKGLNVYRGFVEDENYKMSSHLYDGFIIMNYLEHIPKPNDFLRGIYSNLNYGAIGLIEVPNVNMIIDNLMFSEFISDHIMYFTEDTLRFIIEKNGFEVIESNYVWHDYVIAMTVRKRKKFNLEKFDNQFMKISNQINAFIDCRNDRGMKIAVWGAGHQALSVISMTNIANKIEFIIDSAKFKQNKYTPATHVKVLSPDVLRYEKIDAILVMAASYSDEVANIIRRMYPDIEIAILRSTELEVWKDTMFLYEES